MELETVFVLFIEMLISSKPHEMALTQSSSSLKIYLEGEYMIKWHNI